MKHCRLSGFLIGAAMVFLLTSCGGSGDQKSSTTDTTAATDTTAKTEEVASPKNTIVTTQENMMIVTHKVANYDKWLPVYEAHDSARLASGVHSYVIGRGWKDTNMVLVALKLDDVAKAKTFGKDPSLKKAMQKSGVIGAPTISYYTVVWQDTAKLDTKLRSQTKFTVKDWDAWQKAFDEGKQERIDNGIAVRVIGHDADDNKKVTLVTALLDTAKAFAYYKSDALKKRREAGGVVGEPTRFLFQVVKRY